MMKTPPKGRAGRVEKRAVKTMGKAQKNWTKAEAIRKFDKTKEGKNFAQDEFGTNASMKANQLYKRAGRQDTKAKRQMEKSQFLKASKATPKSKIAMSGRLREAGEETSSMAAAAAAKKQATLNSARNNAKWDSKKVTKK
jgi:hypothetical protein